jgi:hypothetical protein
MGIKSFSERKEEVRSRMVCQGREGDVRCGGRREEIGVGRGGRGR